MTQNGKAKEDMKLLGLSVAYENVTFLPWFINVQVFCKEDGQYSTCAW